VKINAYNQVEVSETEAFTALYNNKITSLNGVFIDNSDTIKQYNQAKSTNADKIPTLFKLLEPNLSLEEFDTNLQDDWFMPESYKPASFNIVEYLLSLCKSDIETNRVLDELKLFAQYNMIDLLCYLKYLVDTMRKNNILWGVGRGSSVASYCLYLLGVHKVNSITYDLDIREFLK
jgi:DNA polymerase III alpha subunit